MLGGCEDLGDGAGFVELSVGDDGDLVSDAAGEAHFVGDEDEVAVFLAELLDHFEDLGGHFGIEGGSGFIEEEEAGFDGDGAGDGDALSLSAGEFGRFFVAVIGEAESFEEFHGVGLGIGWAVAVDFFQGQGDVLQGSEMGEKVEGLKDGADGTPVAEQAWFVEFDRAVVDTHAPCIGVFEAGDNAEESGFAAAGGADEDEGVDLFEAQGDVVQHEVAIETFAEILQFELHSGFKAMFALEGTGPHGDGEGENEIADGQGEKAFKWFQGVGVDFAGIESELVDGNDREKRGVLDERDELTGKRRQDVAERLGKDDIAISLGRGEADGFSGFELGLANTLDAGTNDFADVSAAEQGEGEDADEVTIVDSKSRGNDVEEDQDLNQERGAADEFDVEFAEVIERQEMRTLCQGETEAEEGAAGEGCQGDKDCVDPAVEEFLSILKN